MSRKCSKCSKGLTEAQILLAQHLRELGLRPEFEVQFMESRSFRFDVACRAERLGFECNGHFKGIHGKSFSGDAEKMNLAQMQGWRVLVFHNREVLTGKAKAFIKEHLKP